MKNKMVKNALCLGTLIILISCRNVKKEPQVTTVSHDEIPVVVTDSDLNAVGSTSPVRFKNEALKGVYTAYLEVKAALVNTDAATVTKKGAVLVKQLKAANAKEAITVAALAIASNQDINKQRESFGVLSAETEELLKDAIASGEVYKQFCPMAFDGKGGYWLSDSKEIRNPYFGNKMLKCGMVQETFK